MIKFKHSTGKDLTNKNVVELSSGANYHWVLTKI
jgi:hypothetical protein